MKKKIFTSLLTLFLLVTMCTPVFAANNLIISGDVTKNGTVSIDDVKTTLNYMSGIQCLTNAQLEQADIDRNGTIASSDAKTLLRIAANIEPDYPKEYTPWVVTVEPTCNKTGVATSQCITDGKTYTRTIKKTDNHHYVNGVCSVCTKTSVLAKVSVNGKEINFGDSISSVKTALGAPTESLTSGTTTYLVYNANPAKLSVAIFDGVRGFKAIYTTDRDISLKGLSKSISLGSSATSPSTETVDNCDAEFLIDYVGETGAYAAIYSVDDTDFMELNSSSNISTYEKLIFLCTNNLRAINGLPALEYDSSVAAVARSHSEDMATKEYFSHTNLEGLGPDTRLNNAGIPWLTCGENIIAGYETPFHMADGWYNSEGHRNNMLNKNFTHIGIGVAYLSTSYYQHYATQNFIG